MNDQMSDWFPFPIIQVFTNKKKAKKYVKAVTGGSCKCHFLPKAATTSYYEGSGLPSYAVIYIDMSKVEGTSLSQKLALIAHECSHIVDAWADEIGEDKMGTETRAYALQSALLGCCEQLGEDWFMKRS